MEAEIPTPFQEIPSQWAWYDLPILLVAVVFWEYILGAPFTNMD